MVEPVTVLVPNYNGARFLPRVLPALLAQDHPSFRVVVLDNASTDDSGEVARSFADDRLELRCYDEHLPIVGNLNRGIETVETPLFATCAVDESYEPQWLSTLARLLAEDPRAFVACVKADSIDDKDRIYLAPQERFKDKFWPREEPVSFDPRRQVTDLQLGNYLILTTCLFRTDSFRAIGPFDERLTFVGDWEYWFRGLFAGFSIVGTHRRLVHYRRHGAMTTQSMQSSLESFQQEADLCDWIAHQGHERGLLNSSRPDYSLVCKTVLIRLGTLLSVGDLSAADRLMAFAFDRIPELRTSMTGRLMRLARESGRLGGMVMQAAQAVFLRLPSRSRTWRPA